MEVAFCDFSGCLLPWFWKIAMYGEGRGSLDG